MLRLGADSGSQRMLWPQAPEVPRYLYAGQLTGEQNFLAPGEAKAGRFKAFLHWVAGLVGGEDTPIVLQRPQSGAVDPAGRIFVTDASRRALFVFDAPAGELKVWEKAEGFSNFESPIGVAVGPGGTILVSDAQLGIVARLDAAGEPQAAIGRGELQRPTGLAWDVRSDRIYVADTQAHAIKVFDSQGRMLGIFGRRGDGPGEFNYPTFLALHGDELFVVDSMNHRVQVIDAATGGHRRSFGERGLYVGNLVRPKGVAIDRERNVYVVESYFDHLLVFDRRGDFLLGYGGVGRDPGKFYLPAGVWTDDRDRVFVADMFNGRVMVFQFLGGGADGEP